jgi:hypothetical protein
MRPQVAVPPAARALTSGGTRALSTRAWWHWPALVPLAAGVALRLMALLAYRPALFYIDTARYLSNQAFGMDPLGYKAPLVAIGAVGGFGAVVAVQHLLGLGIAALIYVLLLRRGAGRWLAALAVAPVLLDAYQVQIEQTLMPDVWFEALIVAGLAILLWQRVPGWRRVVAAGLVLGTSATVAQVGEALLLPAVIYVIALRGGWRTAAGKAGALCGAFALPILAYCTGSYLLAGEFFLSHTGVTTLYGRTAAAADCATLQLPPAEAGMCPSPAQQARGPDWLEYFGPVQRYYRTLPRAQVNSMVTDFSHRVLTQQPVRVGAAYGRDVVTLFMLARTAGHANTPISRWQFQLSYPYYQHAGPRYVASQAGGPPQVSRPLAGFLRGYQLNGGYTPGPLFLVLTLAGLGGSILALRWRPGPVARGGTAPAAVVPEARSLSVVPEARSLSTACLLFFGSAVSVLAVSDLFEFSWRYQLPALVTLVPGGALGIAAILAAGRRAR